jgi:tetratricopeptide (TPR) repeat protein
MLPRLFWLGLVAAFLCRVACAAPDQWIEVSTAHFTVITDSNEKQGRHIADQFERMRWVFQALYPKANVDPAEPIVVIAAKNQKVFQTMEPAAYLAKGQMKLGGYYSHTEEKNYVLLQLDAEYEHPFASVYHEYTHLQFLGASAWMPLWLNEGLAEFMQNTEIRDKDVLLGEPSVDDILYLRQNKLIPLDVLFKVDASSPYYHEEQKGSVFYAESWALTHFLMVTDHDKHTNRMGDYMNLVSHDEDQVTAAKNAFGDLKQFQKALEGYIQQANYKEFVLSSAAAPIDESTYKVRTLTQVEFDARRADVLSYVDRETEARTLLDAVLKEDPNNVQAHETMGYLEIHAGHHDEARKWYGEAVKLDSRDYLAYFNFASLRMNESRGEEDREIKDSLKTAIQLNPLFAPSYDRLAVYFAMRRENLDEAHLLSLHAIQLDPGEPAFRINAANVLMAMQRFDDAIAVLRVAEKVAKNPGQMKMIQTQIDQVERFQKEQEEAESYARTSNGEAGANATGAPGVVTSAGEHAATANQTQEVVTVNAEPPKHPTVPDTGRKHVMTGTIRGVACSYPSVIEFRLEIAPGKSVALYNNNFTGIDLSEVQAKPNTTVNPCGDFEGKKAEVEYVDSPDKTVNGQVVAILLRN